ncbi:type II toxin-antitoxin system PemK/MazF family toxin [Thalassobacillus devorans]|uniref:type II toxin-antitoxin system PemK/MazF family toxin n=1 Tax=Thalassobacillus devorans TaxID=279813 RepID=UPI000A1CEAAA|nr:type II toxin-antitoxin system PemK/MazF family toxin [Thalassobacillus devorans]
MGRGIEPAQVRYANVPKEEDPNALMERPCVIVEVYEETNEVAIIKLTKENPRPGDPYDYALVHWKRPHAGLPIPSTARCGKLVLVDESQILNLRGKLHVQDEVAITAKLEEFFEKGY